MTKKIVPFQYQPSGILPDDSKDFTGLTQEEYEFLLWDIEQMIEWGNRTYGYGEAGYLGKDGNYYLGSPNDAYVDHTTKTKVKIKTGAVANAVEKSKIQDRDLFLSFIHKRLEAFRRHG